MFAVGSLLATRMGISNILTQYHIEYEYEYELNKLHTTEIVVADINFIFLFHQGRETTPSDWHRHTSKFWGNYQYFTPRLCVYGLIQPFHISLTLPISHYKYIEWSGMVEIGIWALKWSPQPIFEI